MSDALPTYTEYSSRQSQGQDHLGAESVALSIQAELLSGITSITPRARYYSFYAWTLYDFLRSGAPRKYQVFAPFLRRREAAFILANLAAGSSMGLLGVTKGQSIWNRHRDQSSVPLDFPYLKAAHGGYGANYRAPMEDLRIIKRQDGDAIDHLVQGKGLPLAQAFEQAIAGTSYFQSYRDAESIPPEVLIKYGQACALDAVSDPNAPDRELLRTLLLPLDPKPNQGVLRRQSLGFFLDVVRQAPEAPMDAAAFRRVMYYGWLPNGQRYTPPAGLEVTFLAWRMFQHRQYYVFGLEAMWTYFLERIGWRPASLQWVVHELADVELNEVGIRSLTGTLAATRLHDLVAKINATLSADPAGPVSEENLVRLIQSRTDAAHLMGGGLLLMLATYCRLRREGETGLSPWAFSRAGSPDRLPYSRFVRDLEEGIQTNVTLLEWIGHLMNEYLIGQHNRVALQKLAWNGLDTYRFSEEDGEYSLLYRDQPKFSTFRGHNAMQMLADLGLWTTDGLTMDGIRWLKRALSAPAPGADVLLSHICSAL